MRTIRWALTPCVRPFLFVAAGITAATSTTIPAQADDDAAEDTSGVVEEIVVTSRRRDESQQDVPLSVTAFGVQELEQIKPRTLRDLDGIAPNVYIGMNTAGPGASALYIRGVGYADIEKTQSPQVGVIVDGVQMGSSTGQLVDAFDIESIEVNRGPQGVLFGKNTIGGNIVVNRSRPQFNDWGFQGSAAGGNYDTRIVKARVNIPLIDDQLALKVGATDRQRDGYYDNLTLGGSAGDVEYSAQTIALRWAPSDAFDAILTYDKINDESQIPPQDPRFNGSQPFENLADKREPANYDVGQLGLRVRWDISDSLVLNSISAFHDGDDKVNQDFDGGAITGTAVPFAQLHTLRDQSLEVFTQELRLSGDINDQLDFMVGVYYYDSDLDFRQDTNNVLQLPPVAVDPNFAGLPCQTINDILAPVLMTPNGLNLRPNPSVGDALCQFPNARSTQIAGEEVESWAVFGSINYRPTDELELSIGVRAIEEEKEAFNSYFDFTDATFDTGGPATEHDFTGRPIRVGTAYSADDDWDDVIFTASANWAFSDNNRAYVSYSEGFRSGGFSIRSARDPSEASFEPEDAFQYEVGIKNDFFDRRLRLNLAYFYLERDGSQFSSIITLPPGSIPGTTTLINNGGTQELQGVELEATWAATDNLTLSLNSGIIDVENEEFTIACELLDGCATGTPGVTDPLGTQRVLGGNDDSRQPEWNYSFTAAWESDFEGGSFFANVGYKKVGDFLLVNTGGGADQRLFEGGYAQLDARIALEFPMENGDSLMVSLYGKNLTDEEWREQALFLGGFNTGFQGWGAPATYAFEIQYTH